MTDSGPARDQRELLALLQYLGASGWKRTDTRRSLVWSPPTPSSTDIQVVLPNRPDVTDLSTYLEEAVRVVGFVSEMTPREVWTAALDGGADTLSLRLVPYAASGSAPLALAQESFTALRRLLVGATAALNTDALVLPSRRSTAVETYAAEALVTTRPGSFIVDVSLPLNVTYDPKNAPDGQDTLLDAPTLPMGRRVSRRVITVAENALDMAQRIVDGDAAVSAFGNPNLRLGNALELDALARLGADEPTDYQLRVTQSPLADGRAAPKRLRATPEQREQLGNAAEYLRNTQARANVEVHGFVVRLSRDSAFGAGDVTVRAVLDDSGRMRSCLMSVTEVDYVEAVRAHQEGKPVTVRGDLVTSGNNRTRLRNITLFQVASD